MAKKQLPKKTFWETYSAFANTDDGTILLGVREFFKRISFMLIKWGA